MRLLVPVVMVGGLLVLCASAVTLRSSSQHADANVEASGTRALRLAEARLAGREQRLLSAARQIAVSRTLRSAIEGEQPSQLRADVVGTQVAQGLDFIGVADTAGRSLVDGPPVPDLLGSSAFRRSFSDLEASGIEWFGDELWLLAAVLYRAPGHDPVSVIVGERLSTTFMGLLAQQAGLPVTIGIDGHVAGAEPGADVIRSSGRFGEATLNAFVPLSAFHSQLVAESAIVAAVGSTALVLFSLVIWIVIGSVVRPLRLLSSAALALAEGDRSRPVPTEGASEIAATGVAFNLMSAAVVAREAELGVMYEEVQASAREMAHRATHDLTTGLPNRALVNERLEGVIERSDGAPSAVLVLDLDDFKAVNDAFGHHVGDEVLRQVGGRLTSLLRPGDTVGRLGGDEFAVLLPGLSGADGAEVGGRLRDALGRPFHVDGRLLQVNASFGVVEHPRDGVTVDELARRSDIAMFVAKRSEIKVVQFTAEQEQLGVRRMVIAAELRAALERDELELWYQPIVTVRTGKVHGVEALVRWNHPTRGLVLPSEFIPVAEETGIVTALTQWVLRRAARDAARLVTTGGGGVPVSVNLSAHDLRQPGLVSRVHEALAEHALPADLLRLEITESAVMADPKGAQVVLAELRATGVKIEIDDFGTGHSSLAYLQRFQVDTIKIDRSFVAGTFSDESSAPIVRAAVALAHALGAEVVAEGVEDQRVWDFLAEVGCDNAQGYFLSKPLRLGDLERWLVSSGRMPGRTAPGREVLPSPEWRFTRH